jgi:hypothetical protein
MSIDFSIDIPRDVTIGIQHDPYPIILMFNSSDLANPFLRCSLNTGTVTVKIADGRLTISDTRESLYGDLGGIFLNIIKSLDRHLL